MLKELPQHLSVAMVVASGESDQLLKDQILAWEIIKQRNFANSHIVLAQGAHHAITGGFSYLAAEVTDNLIQKKYKKTDISESGFIQTSISKILCRKLFMH